MESKGGNPTFMSGVHGDVLGCVKVILSHNGGEEEKTTNKAPTKERRTHKRGDLQWVTRPNAEQMRKKSGDN